MKKALISSWFQFLAVIVCWQAMHELYKFNDDNWLVIVFLLCLSFLMLFFSKR